MAIAGITKYDAKISGNILVLGSTGSVKTTLVPEMANDSSPNYSSLNKRKLK